MNNKPDKVMAIKGSKIVSLITSGKKEEFNSVLSCCNSKKSFLLPYSIIKGKDTLNETLDEDHLKKKKKIKMSLESAFANSDTYLD